MAPVAEGIMMAGQAFASDACAALASGLLIPPAHPGGGVDDARYLKRLKANVLASLAFVPLQLPQPALPPAAAPAGGCGERQQFAARRISGRDPASKPQKIRRVSYLEEERLGAGYDPEYLEHCYAEESKGAADWRYLTSVQREVDAHKRLVLVDWLVEVVDEFKLGQGTLFLAVNLVDRFLSRVAVARGALQLLGVTALWLASKFEEVYPPTLSDFVDVTQHSCSARQLIDMEAALLREVGFTLMVPTPVTFLTLFLPAAAANAADADAFLSAAIDGDGCDSDDSAGAAGAAAGRMPPADAPTGPRAAPRYPYPAGGPCPSAGGAGGCGAPPPAGLPAAAALGDFPRRVGHLAEYLLELSLLTPEALRFPPSLAAAAALHLACSLLGAPPGARARLAPAADAAAARAGEERLRACVGELRRMYAYAARAPRPPAVKSKYSTPARASVAAAPPPRWALEA
ncbi:MAG: hypothetical protein J3K34DRAFT_521756 [Monoraphidium minutum]|nr:MAG: hypothetical protein J3K34DRAFT_521756 [Monoraphidium minutum]